MSLLMDALKKAEQEKQKAQAASSAERQDGGELPRSSTREHAAKEPTTPAPEPAPGADAPPHNNGGSGLVQAGSVGRHSQHGRYQGGSGCRAYS